MTRPALSVILPNHNHGRLIGEALEAILAQSLPPTEVLVIDDASTDDSVAVVERFARGRPGVRLERNERNLNVIATVNKGLGRVSGTYVYCASSDDRVLPGLFERSVELLESHPRAAFCCSRADLLGPGGERLGLYQTPAVRESPGYLDPPRVLEAYIRRGAWIVPQSVVYRRRAFVDIGGFDLELGAWADNFNYHLLSAKHGCCFIPDPLVAWRPAPDSYCRQSSADLESSLAVIAELERRMITTYREVFTDEYVAAMRRWSLAGALYDIMDRKPGRHDEIARLGAALGSGGLRDRAFFSAWRCYLGLGRLFMKLYHFALQPSADKRRIAAGKLLGR